LNLTSTALALGLILGGWASGVCFWFFWFTRSHRKVKNKLVFRIGYAVIGLSTLGPLLVFRRSLERMNIGRGTPQDDAALCAYTIGFASVAALTLWSELKWRKSVGLSDKKLGASPE
jgi:hypothetical protein